MQRLKAELIATAVIRLFWVKILFLLKILICYKKSWYLENQGVLVLKAVFSKTKNVFFSAKFQVFGIILTSFTQRVIYSLTARRTPKTRTQIRINVDEAAIKLQTSVL